MSHLQIVCLFLSHFVGTLSLGDIPLLKEPMASINDTPGGQTSTIFLPNLS